MAGVAAAAALSSSGNGYATGGGGGGSERVLMALAHRSLPHFGVQFHPESVATAYGGALLRNFAALTCRHHGAGLSLPSVPPSLRLEGVQWRFASRCRFMLGCAPFLLRWAA